MANHPYSSTPAYQPDDNWQASALCAQTDPALFFPDAGGNTNAAKRICRTCPVQAECLAEALKHGHRYGIWGAHSERQLRQMRPARLSGNRIDSAEAVRLHAMGMKATEIARQLHCSPQGVTAAIRRAAS